MTLEDFVAEKKGFVRSFELWTLRQQNSGKARHNNTWHEWQDLWERWERQYATIFNDNDPPGAA